MNIFYRVTFVRFLLSVTCNKLVLILYYYKQIVQYAYIGT